MNVFASNYSLSVSRHFSISGGPGLAPLTTISRNKSADGMMLHVSCHHSLKASFCSYQFRFFSFPFRSSLSPVRYKCEYECINVDNEGTKITYTGHLRFFDDIIIICLGVFHYAKQWYIRCINLPVLI